MAMYEDAASEEVLRERLRIALHDLRNIKTWKQAIDIHQERQDNRIGNLNDAIERIDKKLDRVNSTMNRLLFGITASSLTLSVSILVATGKIGTG